MKEKLSPENPTARDLLDYLLTLADVPQDTVDRIIFGSPDTKIKKIGTCWISSFANLKKAYEAGVNVLVTHEPTFYTHLDLFSADTQFSHARKEKNFAKGETAYLSMIEEKKAWILEHNMTIIRCHDVADIVQGFGIARSLGKTLGFEEYDETVGDLYYKVYIIQPDTAYNVTVNIAKKLAGFNQSGVQFYGDGNRIVRRIGVGTGCLCDPVTYMEYSADYYLAINDSISTWTQAPYSNDSGLPMGVIDHGTSEEAGMRALCEHLNENYYPCVHINGGAGYQFITG